MGPYNAEEYADLNLNEYRERFPSETMRLTDKQIWDICAATEDDMDDDEWRKLFLAPV